MTLQGQFSPLTPSELRSNRPAPDDDLTPVLPAPERLAKAGSFVGSRNVPPGFQAAGSWRYFDENGRLLCIVARYGNGRGAKEFRPFAVFRNAAGEENWHCRALPAPRPLYGLDRLAARPDAPILVCEGEKAADAAGKRFPVYVCITSSGGARAASKANWSPLAGRHVVVWPDADRPGAEYAADVSRLIAEVGAASVRIVKLPIDLPIGWDLADELPDGVSDTDLAKWPSEADPTVRAEVTEGPLPLFPPLPPAAPFPVNALGPFLAEAALAIAVKVQVPIEIAAQSVLAAAALAVQAHADIQLPYGQTRPTSLDFVTIAASGDRKSTADNEALWPIRLRESVLREQHQDAMKAWRIDSAAWSATKKKIEADGKLDYDGRRTKLEALGEEPRKPLAPILTTGDVTPDGLTKNWPWMHGALGVFSAEGGQFTGGHGMTDDNRLRTAAMLSELWDGKPVARVRAMDGVSVLYGRRLSVHLMIQPEAAASFLADPTLRDQGLLSRILVAAPASIAGTRLYRQPSAEDEATIKCYGARLLELLETPPKTLGDAPNELAPRVLPLDAEATAAWTSFFNHVESQCQPGGNLRPIFDFAAKVAEHAARLAGVIVVVENPAAIEIDKQAMACGISLGDWYLTEALRLASAARTDTRLLKAQALLDWLHERGEAEVGFREIVQFGPTSTRTKTTADEAVSILTSHGWLKEASSRPRRFAIIKGE